MLYELMARTSDVTPKQAHLARVTSEAFEHYCKGSWSDAIMLINDYLVDTADRDKVLSNLKQHSLDRQSSDEPWRGFRRMSSKDGSAC